MKKIVQEVRIGVLMLALSGAFVAQGRDIDYGRAMTIASEFLQARGINAPAQNLRKAKVQVRDTQTNEVNYYVINGENSFVVVSADSRTQPVLAYGLDAPFTESEMPEAVKAMLDSYDAYIQDLEDGAAADDTPAANYGEGRLIETATWNQNPSPWWDACPMHLGSHTYGGCVATAMSIIMRYNQWPLSTGYGSESYTTKTFEIPLSVDFGAQDYKLASLPLDGQDVANWTDEQRSDIATLIFNAGVAAFMNYRTDSSDAFAFAAISGLYKHFGYTLGGMLVKNDCADIESYLSQIIAELDLGYPMFYSGVDIAGEGHTFICDGYDSDGRLHFNYGWSGVSNGYYTILDTDMKYFNDQCALYGMRPDQDAKDNSSVEFAHLTRSEQPMISVAGGKMMPGTRFTVNVNSVTNICGYALESSFGIMLVDAEGQPRMLLGKSDVKKIDYGYTISGLNIQCALPTDFVPSEGDCLCLCYRTEPVLAETDPEIPGDVETQDPDADQSDADPWQEWRPVVSYDPANATIDVSTVFTEPEHQLVMIKTGTAPYGLIQSGLVPVNASGIPFGVTARYLENIMVDDFVGDAAIMLCSAEGDIKQNIGQYSIPGLSSLYYYENFSISCVIKPEDGAVVGDYLALYTCRKDSEKWYPVVCEIDSLSHITLTDDIYGKIELPTPVTIDSIRLAEDNVITADGKQFVVECVNVYDNVAFDVKGTLAIYVCDANGQPTAQIGAGSFSLDPTRYYPIFQIACAIPADIELAEGYKLGVFAKYDISDEWYPIICTDPELSYIMLPEVVGINDVIVDGTQVDAIYNINGVKVDRATRGLFIINGKKVMVK